MSIDHERLDAARTAVAGVQDDEVKKAIEEEARRREENRGRREETRSFGSAQARCPDTGCNAFKRAANAVCTVCGLDPRFGYAG